MSIDSKTSVHATLENIRGGRMTFGEMIESVRKADGITQAELAQRLEVSRAHLYDIEKNRRAVSPERATQFAGVLEYSVNQFVAKCLEDSLVRAGLDLQIEVKAA